MARFLLEEMMNFDLAPLATRYVRSFPNSTLQDRAEFLAITITALASLAACVGTGRVDHRFTKE